MTYGSSFGITLICQPYFLERDFPRHPITTHAGRVRMLKGAIGEFMSLNAKWNPLVFSKSKTAIACWNDVKNNVIHSNWIHSSQEKFDVWKHSPKICIKFLLNDETNITIFFFWIVKYLMLFVILKNKLKNTHTQTPQKLRTFTTVSRNFCET